MLWRHLCTNILRNEVVFPSQLSQLLCNDTAETWRSTFWRGRRKENTDFLWRTPFVTEIWPYPFLSTSFCRRLFFYCYEGSVALSRNRHVETEPNSAICKGFFFVFVFLLLLYSTISQFSGLALKVRHGVAFSLEALNSRRLHWEYFPWGAGVNLIVKLTVLQFSGYVVDNETRGFHSIQTSWLGTNLNRCSAY